MTTSSEARGDASRKGGILLSTAYLAPVQAYARMYAADVVWEERCETFQKQTWRNRCLILSANGPLALTVPTVHCGGNVPVSEVRISMQGNWQKLHWNALVSAYERSPYFEYYADSFRPFYEERWERLADFNAAMRDTVLRLLGIKVEVRPTTEYVRDFPGDDCRALISPKRALADDRRFRQQPYCQVFRHKYGFVPGLSIADLLFNMGPESRIILRDSLRRE